MEIDNDWITPQQAADLLGVTVGSAHTYACKFGWGKKPLGKSPFDGVLYWADDVREELPNHGRTPSRWEV